MERHAKSWRSSTPLRLRSHAAAAALACSDAAFNRLTGTTAGNPYKARIAELQRDGVQTEICVKSMEFQKIAKS